MRPDLILAITGVRPPARGGARQRPARGEQILATVAQIRLEVGALRPFIPGIDEDQPLFGTTVIDDAVAQCIAEGPQTRADVPSRLTEKILCENPARLYGL